MRRASVVVWALVALACGSESPPSSCTPGVVAACTCADQRPGAQGCTDNGTWGPCVFCGQPEKLLGPTR